MLGPGGGEVEKHVKLFQIAQKELVEKHPYCMEQKMFVKEFGTCKYFLDFYLCKMIFVIRYSFQILVSKMLHLVSDP